MKLYEYQAKALFKEAQIAIPNSVRIETTDAAEEALQKVGYPCVIKAQVLTGGRGKAGLIQFVKTKPTALEAVKTLFDHPVQIPSLLIEEAIDIDQEVYLSITVDAAAGKALVLASAEGGVDIEVLAAESPEKILRYPIDILIGMMPYQAREIAYDLGFNAPLNKSIAQTILRLYHVFITYHAELVEINPLFITKSQTVIAGDGKVSIDDNSTHWHQAYENNETSFGSEAEKKAHLEGIPFIEFDGDIGLMCAGAGLTTTVYDLINDAGGSIANYLEFGGPNYKKALQAMEICLAVPSKVILIVTFGTIARADVMAQGIVDAIEKLKPNRPIITCIRGTNEQEAVNILESAGLKPLFDTEEAVLLAVSMAKGETQ